MLNYSPTAFLNAVDVIHNKQKGQEVLGPRGSKTYFVLSIASGILTKGQMRCFWAGKLNLSSELYNEFINGIQIKQLKISLHILLYFCNSSCMPYKHIRSSCLRAFIKKCRFFSVFKVFFLFTVFQFLYLQLSKLALYL